MATQLKQKLNINVREATFGDLAGLIKVGKSAFSHEYRSDTDDLSRKFFISNISNPFNSVYVAVAEGKILGYAIYLSMGLTGTVELFQVGVIKKRQSQGVGTALLLDSMKMCEDRMRAKGVDVYAMFLTTSSDNPVGQKLYRNAGFRVKGTIRDTFVGIGNKEIVMTKILDKSRVYKEGSLWTPRR